MAKITIDGTEYELEAGKNLLQAALEAGLDIPYFCWHPALGSVGACRQCAVKQYRDEEDERGMIAMSCMVPCTDGARFSIEDDEAREFRKTVAEWLMTNHPHDCPVCDEGGECHLQDMTVMTGHNYRSYRFTKRTFKNQDLGPHINHEMNRCITCYRCVRFYDDYAGGKDLQAIGSHNHIFFGRHEDGTLENEFSGNLVEVCPTGVFTDKTFKQHYLRKWDLQTAPSVCQGCGIGCNIIPGERSGQLRRILNRYHGELNGYFICDRGRFGYEYVNGGERIRIPSARANGAAFQDLNEAGLAQRLKALIAPGKTLLGIGSPRASLESNFALRSLVGPDHFSSGLTEKETELTRQIIDIRSNHPAPIPSLKDIENADAVLVLGEDLTNTAPRMALSVRQSIRNQPGESLAQMRIPEWSDKSVRLATTGQSGPLFTATPAATRLDDIVTGKIHGGSEEISRVGFAIAHALDGTAPAANSLSPEHSEFVEAVAKALRDAKRPVIISGMTLGDCTVIQAAANVALALHTAEREAGLAYVVPESNTLGSALLGGMSLEQALKCASEETPDALIIVENDLYRRLPVNDLDAILSEKFPVLAIEHSRTRTTAKADMVLPAGPFSESDGTLINFEGRAQRFFQVYPAPEAVQESWRWIRDLLEFRDSPYANEWSTLDDILLSMEEDLPGFKGVAQAAPLTSFREIGGKIPRMSRRASGRTAIQAHVEVSEDKPEEDPDSPLSFSMEGSIDSPASLMSRYWAPGWNSVSALNKFQDEIGGHLRGGDPGVILLKTEGNGEFGYFQAAPPPENPEKGSLRFLPIPHIFGSEEWSARCDGIRKRGPGLHLLLNGADAQSAGLKEGDLAKISIAGMELTLPVQPSESLIPGTAGLTPGLPGLEGIPLPSTGKLVT